MNQYKTSIEVNGFAVIENVFSKEQVQKICKAIENANDSGATFRKSADLFAIRQFLKEVPEIQSLIFTDIFDKLIVQLFGND